METVIELGPLKTSYDASGETNDRDRLTLAWQNVTYSVKQSKKKDNGEPLAILHGLSGVVRPGQMLAIIGGSGAGKSTLMNILSGRADAAGQIGPRSLQWAHSARAREKLQARGGLCDAGRCVQRDVDCS